MSKLNQKLIIVITLLIMLIVSLVVFIANISVENKLLETELTETQQTSVELRESISVYSNTNEECRKCSTQVYNYYIEN